MNEEKQSDLEERQASNGVSKEINPAENAISNNANHDVLKWIIIGLVGLAVVVLIFGAGMIIGGMKAKFSYRWAESYHKNFAGPRSGFFGDWRKVPPLPGEFIEGHGAFGEIIEIKDNGFVIKGRGDIEKIVIVSEETIVKRGMATAKNGLGVGDGVVIIGSPNEEGQIEAKLIRVFNGELKGSSLPYKGPRLPFF